MILMATYCCQDLPVSASRQWHSFCETWPGGNQVVDWCRCGWLSQNPEQIPKQFRWGMRTEPAGAIAGFARRPVATANETIFGDVLLT